MQGDCSPKLSLVHSKRRQSSFPFLACTLVAALCIVTASSSPQPEAAAARASVALAAPGHGNEIFTGLSGPQFNRTAFHFQPPRYWINDPCAPMYYKGWYHIFFEYNPWGAIWGNISWGHAVSEDLVNWIHLEPAITFDQEYDIGGVWSGSASIRESDGLPIILYTGVAENLTQTQNMATPADLEDPFLVKWVKHPENPLLYPPAGVGHTDFRDPTTAWKGEDGQWLMSVGAQNGFKTGMALVYKSTDLVHWELSEDWLYAVNGTGIWECVDFFPLGEKHVLKVSSWDEYRDYYAVGTYNGSSFHAETSPVIYGLVYDHGKVYAAKSFYDPVKSRQISWVWSKEGDTEAQDIAKGWAGVMAIPRVISLDSKLGDRVLQTPIEELKRLRRDNVSKRDIILDAGSVQKLNGSAGGQLDIEVTFDYPDVDDHSEVDVVPFNCSASGGAAHRGVLGPFGLLVMTDDALVEQTAVFFYISQSKKREWSTHFCSDQSRSTLMEGVERTVYQGDVVVLPDERQLSLRVLVDHSIIESFVQGGRTAIVARMYPSEAVQANAHVFLFNNGTTDITVRRIDVWQMENINSTTYVKAPPESVEESEPVKQPAITEGIPQVHEPFLASHVADVHRASSFRPVTKKAAQSPTQSPRPPPDEAAETPSVADEMITTTEADLELKA